MNPAMLSLPRPFNPLPPAVSLSSSSHHHQHHPPSLLLAPIRSSAGGDGGSSNGGETINNEGSASAAPTPPPITPPDEGIRFKRGSRRRRKQQQEDGIGGQPQKIKAAAPKKEWESMTLNEKAVELYMGEKGLLFWLNKFAYASIFIVIGGWIVFRFVGPAFNLYQLDAPPLEPTSIFKGS